MTLEERIAEDIRQIIDKKTGEFIANRTATSAPAKSFGHADLQFLRQLIDDSPMRFSTMVPVDADYIVRLNGKYHFNAKKWREFHCLGDGEARFNFLLDTRVMDLDRFLKQPSK